QQSRAMIQSSRVRTTTARTAASAAAMSVSGGDATFFSASGRSPRKRNGLQGSPPTALEGSPPPPPRTKPSPPPRPDTTTPHPAHDWQHAPGLGLETIGVPRERPPRPLVASLDRCLHRA